MALMDLIRSRTSVRKYLDKPVPEKDIRTCLEAARLAPSAQNSQPWHFIILQNRETIESFGRKVFSGIYLPTSFASKASAISVVLAKPDFKTNVIGKQIQDIVFYLQDLGISGEHFVLQAWELGIGTCWIGWFNEKEARKFLEIPKSFRIVSLIAMGYPAVPPVYKKRRELDDIVMKWIR